MFKKRPVNAYFDVIKQNHKEYLATQMVTHLGIAGTENKKAIIDLYLLQIHNFRELKKDELNDDIRGATTAETLERGTFSALLGMLIGGLFFAATQKNQSGDLLGAKTAIQGGFATAIGASCGALIYSAWDQNSEKPAHADLKACEEEMKKAGFTDERYAQLSANLVKLFHFRECLLLGLEDKNKVNMRDAYKNQYYSSKNANELNDQDFNLAIEVYFLEELNELFRQAFEKILQVHDEEINEEQQGNEFSKWFKRHFENPENRQKFTQQMQVQFVKNCIDFLESQKNQPGFLGKYLYLIDTIAGLTTASFTIGLFAVTTLFIPVFALVCIGFAAACLGAIAAHLTITQNDSLYYKRDQNNRQSIQVAIENITAEQKRLGLLLQKVVITTPKDLALLKKYYKNNKPSFSERLLGNSQKHIAVGGVRAWIREFANRFNESKIVDIDLSNDLQNITDDAHAQTVMLTTKLTAYMTSTKTGLNTLTQFINDTKNYLKNPNEADFIKTFEVVQKIKEQVLEIVGSISSTVTTRDLPKILIDFYTAPIHEGGLAGLKSDLTQVQHLAPVIAADIPANTDHPYHRFLRTAFDIHIKLNKTTNSNFILPGDTRYRSMLGLPSNQIVQVEKQINAANIQNYLTESFDFLCSLNQYETHKDWEGAFQNTDQFIIYRMLFVKQLANLTDPNNLHVDRLVKDAIKRFARVKLNYNPDVAFDDILNQALLVKSGTKWGVLYDPLNKPRLLSELSFIADAIRVDMAYVSSSLSPKQLIDLEAHHFLMNADDKIILGFNSMDKLTPELSTGFYNKMDETIKATQDFLTSIKTSPLMQQTNTITLYVEVIKKEISRVKQEISVLKPLLVNSNNLPLDNVVNALEAFKQTLGELPPISPANECPLPDSRGSVAPDKTINEPKKSNTWKYSFKSFGFFSGALCRGKTTDVVESQPFPLASTI